MDEKNNNFLCFHGTVVSPGLAVLRSEEGDCDVTQDAPASPHLDNKIYPTLNERNIKMLWCTNHSYGN